MSRLPWDSLIASDPFPIRPPGVPLWLTARHPAPMGPNRLRIQHLIMGMYEIGCDMVRKQRPFSFYEAYALLSLHHETIAIVTIEKRPATIPVDVGSRRTIPPMVFQNISVNDIPRPAKKGETFSITDYQQPAFRVVGTFTGEDVGIRSVFTALLSALSQIAVHPQENKRASIESVDDNVFARAYFSLHDSGMGEGRGLLSYGQASIAILNLWKVFLAEKKYGGLRFKVEFDGEEIGYGSIEDFSAE